MLQRLLRNDQQDLLQDLRSAVADGERRICVQAPTGYGKTVFAAAITEHARAKKKRLIFTVPAISLVDQTVEMFYSQGIMDVGVIQANHMMTDWGQPVQIASVQTLLKRTIPECDIVLVDECHRVFSFYSRWFCDPKMQNVPIIGLSATPWNREVGALYKHLMIASTTQDLIDGGQLSDFKVFAPTHTDLSGVATVAGDFHEGQLSAKMLEGTLSADVVQSWLRLWGKDKTLCYAVDLLHARKLQEQFKAAGITCGYQDARTKDSERKALKKDFHSGALRVVVSVGTLTTGIDWDVRCISLVRPTKSEMLFVQIVGRGLRTAKGKDYVTILDHSDNHQRLGFVTDIDASHTELPHPKDPVTRSASHIRLPKECPKCAFLKAPGVAICPVCSFEAKAHSRIEPTAGELAEMKRKAKEAKAAPFEPEVFYAQLRCHAINKGFKAGWASMKFKDKFGHWPDRSFDHHPPAREVTPEVASWIRAMNIRWIKGKGKQMREVAKLPLSKGTIVPGTLCTEDDLRDFQ